MKTKLNMKEEMNNISKAEINAFIKYHQEQIDQYNEFIFFHKSRINELKRKLKEK